MNQAVINPTELQQMLARAGQTHVLGFWDQLNDRNRLQLAKQIQAIDFPLLQSLVDQKTDESRWAALAEHAQSPPAITLDDFRNSVSYENAYAAGAAALSAGKVAMILTAGGQGSRLGFDHPKGMFPIGPVSNRSLYQMIIENVLARARQFLTRIPLYVMTSPPTHDESTNYLTENNRFGYPAEDFRIFCQGVMPAVDVEGRLLLSDKGRIFVSPDGHGGTLAALVKDGCLVEMMDCGIEHVFYGQIDNPLIQVCNPALIGYHILSKSEMTTQVVRKNSPLQKVGNVVSIDGQVQIIEYSDLPEVYARQTNQDGSLKLWAGNIAVHVFDSSFLQRANANADSLPYHLAHKIVPFVDSTGKYVQPDEPNAIKFERFIFDLLPLANNAIVCEVNPVEGFCAVKNAPPADSETPDHVKAAISNLHKKWLTDCGVQVARDAVVEISPTIAVEQRQLLEKAGEIPPITESTYLE